MFGSDEQAVKPSNAVMASAVRDLLSFNFHSFLGDQTGRSGVYPEACAVSMRSVLPERHYFLMTDTNGGIAGDEWTDAAYEFRKPGTLQV